MELWRHERAAGNAIPPITSLLVPLRGADAGKPAHYMGRWKNAHAECGPWSETVMATIGAWKPKAEG